ncbi:hypothetical protein K439DRAFT_961077 [Ramaria rubella]|nr:hypothetical protein K439DRAFT_961077 [Ramaria rubella]
MTKPPRLSQTQWNDGNYYFVGFGEEDVWSVRGRGVYRGWVGAVTCYHQHSFPVCLPSFPLPFSASFNYSSLDLHFTMLSLTVLVQFHPPFATAAQ